MPDKTPLELAQRVIQEAADGTFHWGETQRLAAALVERMTPVAGISHDGQMGHCSECKAATEWGNRFCWNCGKPLVWK